MAADSRIRYRRNAAQLHALAQVEREIRAADPCLRRKYLRRFTAAYSRYTETLTTEQLDQELFRADILLLGDYHALPRSQQFAAEVVERFAADGRETVLALEMLFTHHQTAIDAWQESKLKDEELRARIRYDADWGYDWEPFCALLHRARAAGVRIAALDRYPRGDLRRITARDRLAASRITALRSEHPGGRIVVLIGESHLAPQHLPALVQAAHPNEQVTILLQNVDALYWRALGEPAHDVPAVRVDPNTLCVFNASPLEKYENYRIYIERWRNETATSAELAPCFHNLIRALWQALGIEASDWVLPQVLSADSSGLYKLVRGRQHALPVAGALPAGLLSPRDAAQLGAVLEEQGCLYLPELDVFAVRRYELQNAAHEVARFVSASSGGGRTQPGGDGFYSACLHHAFVEFGARVLCPTKPSVLEADLYQMYSRQSDEFSPDEYIKMLDFLVMHRDFERNARKYLDTPKLISRGRGYTGARRGFVASWLGRLLGCEMYDAYLRGVLKRRTLRSILLKLNGDEQRAKAAYFKLVRLGRPSRRRQAA